MSAQKFSASLELIDNYLFEIDFGNAGSIMSDEPEPLGGDACSISSKLSRSQSYVCDTKIQG